MRKCACMIDNVPAPLGHLVVLQLFFFLLFLYTHTHTCDPHIRPVVCWIWFEFLPFAIFFFFFASPFFHSVPPFLFSSDRLLKAHFADQRLQAVGDDFALLSDHRRAACLNKLSALSATVAPR